MSARELGSKSWDLDANCEWLIDTLEGKLYYIFCHECGKDEDIQARGRVERRDASHGSGDPNCIRYCIICDKVLCYTCFVKDHADHLRKVGYSF